MKRILNFILCSVLVTGILFLTVGIGYCGHFIYKQLREEKLQLLEIYDANATLLEIIRSVDEDARLRDQQVLGYSLYTNRKPSYNYLKSVTVRIFQEEQEGSDTGSIGTGSIVKVTDDYTYILTNKHVAPLKAKDRIYVIQENLERVKAEVLKNSAFYDLSLIRIPGKLENKTVVNGFSSSTVAETVYSVGMYLGNYYIYTEGTFAGYQQTDILINAPSSFGCSGSGVFDRDGNLIAVIYATNVLRFFDTDSAKAVCISDKNVQLFLKGII